MTKVGRTTRDQASTFRWTMKRKADLLARLDSGLVDKATVSIELGITEEEITSWRSKVRILGREGLKVRSIPAIRSRRG